MKNRQANLSSDYYNKEDNQETENNSSKVEVIENNTETELEDTEEHFFILNPVIDLEKLAKKYYSKVKVIKKDLTLKEKKENFINEVLPAINQSRKKLLVTYQSILSLQGKKLSIQDEEYLNLLYQTYRIKNKNIEDLLMAVKPHPTSVILAQAILESGWGTSRFFKEANNIFGHWTWTGKGLVPKDRKAGLKHKIKIYDSLEDSIRGYLLNLNVGHSYKKFRAKRERLRKEGKILSGIALAPTLTNYSELKDEYTKLLVRMIKQNKLENYDR